MKPYVNRYWLWILAIGFILFASGCREVAGNFDSPINISIVSPGQSGSGDSGTVGDTTAGEDPTPSTAPIKPAAPGRTLKIFKGPNG